MLKHEDSPQTQSQSAAEVRVSPEELAAAITRLEARKDASQRNLEGTVAIGEIVQQLGLDATSEEVLAEVQAGRIKQRYLKKQPSSKRRRHILLAAFIALGVSGWVVSQHLSGNLSEDGPFTATQPYGPSVETTSISLKPAPNLTVGDVSGKILMLTEVGDNQPVRCTFDNQSSTLQYYYPNSPALWRLVKHDGRVYVRGWMLNASPKVMAENGIDIATENNSGFDIPITLPLDGFKVLPLVGSIASFHAVDVHLDKHAYEKW